MAFDLHAVVKKYLAITGGFGIPAELKDFGMTRGATESLFSEIDEDYHISRFFNFTDSGGIPFSINGFKNSHVSIDHSIESIL